MKKRRFPSLTVQIMIGLVAGILIGWREPEWGKAIKPMADIFLRMIKMIIAPLHLLDSGYRYRRHRRFQESRAHRTQGNHLFRSRHDPRSSDRTRNGKHFQARAVYSANHRPRLGPGPVGEFAGTGS